MGKQRIAVLGAGLAGLGAASRLENHDVVLYDKLDYWGGHASSHQVGEFTFDEGPHVSFTKNERVRNIFSEAVAGEYRELPGIALNYFRGHIFQHPAQFHLYTLPPEIKTQCLIDFVRARSEPAVPVETYRDWCYGQFGKSFSEIFVRQYTRKYWNRELEELSTDWVGTRIVEPSLEQVIEGALMASTENKNYISTFRYPLRGGFKSFGASLAQNKTIRAGYEVVEVDSQIRRLSFSNGTSEDYEWLISSLPLPDLVASMPGAPENVREAVKRLKCTSHFLVNVGVRGEAPPGGGGGFWMYYYDEEIPFSRVNFPSRLSPFDAPEGHYSLQAEVVHSPNKPLGEPKAVVEKSLAWLQKVGLIGSLDDVVLLNTQDIAYANVVFDLERTRSLSVVHDYLLENDITVCGRYGEWAYLWTDEAILSGERAAQQVLERISSKTTNIPGR